MLNHKLLFVICLFFLIQVSAYEAKEGNISATLGSFVYKTNFNRTTSGANPAYLGDFALLINGDINEKGSLEISLFHMRKQYFREIDLKSIVEETQLMHITMGYRRYLSPYFSLGLGFYSAYPMDDATVVHNDFSSNIDMTTSARDITEYGFDFSAQAELWHNESIIVVGDLRYALSITSKSDEKSDHYGIFLGVKIPIQQKFKN